MNLELYSDNMKKTFRHIIAVIAAMVLLASCSRDGAEVIPRSKLSQIYADMLMTDQWILSTPGFRHIADTSLVYEPILKKYGYDSEDYRKTIEVYMNDPERFSRILRTTVSIFDERLAELHKQEKLLEEAEARRKRLAKLKFESDINMNEFFPCLYEEPYVHYYDSVSFEPDSALWIYRLQHIPATDTVFEGPAVKVKTDTLVVNDTLNIIESKILDKEIEEPKKDTLEQKARLRLAKGNKLKSSGFIKDLK